MKISSKITIIGGIGALALIGTGFAAWQFNESITETKDSNVIITPEVKDGSLVISDHPTFYLTLDQDGAFWTTVDYSAKEEAVADADKITTFELKYTGSAKAQDVSDVTLEVTFTKDSAIDTYVTLGAGSLGSASATGNVKTATYTLPTLTYTSSKPTTEAAYKTMKTALASAKVTFTLKATVAA